jgi:hypothetical protein
MYMSACEVLELRVWPHSVSAAGVDGDAVPARRLRAAPVCVDWWSDARQVSA